MDGNIDKVREALIKLRAFAKSFGCDYQEECTPGDDDMCQSCRHVYIADLALAALPTIDPEAIRAEVLREERGRCEDIVCALWPDKGAIRSAILAGGPEERETEAGDIVAYDFADGTTTLDRWDGVRQYNARIIVLMRASEVKRRIEESKQ